MWAVSLPLGRSWWTSHLKLGTPYQVHPDLPHKELWDLGKPQPSCTFEAVAVFLCSPVPGDSHHGYTAYTVRVSEQPCCGCLCISSCYPQSKFPLRFLLLKKHITGFQISLQYSPLFAYLEITLPQELFWEKQLFLMPFKVTHSLLMSCICHCISTLTHVLFKP